MESAQKLNPARWVDEFSDELFRFALLRVNDAETAKDLVQDTFLSALKNVNNFKGEISEKNWLYLILKNKVIDYYRSKSKQLLSEIPSSEELEEDYFFDETGHWKKSVLPQPWEYKINSNSGILEFKEILARCREKLTEIQNICFAMKFLDDRDADEICKELKIAASNYWVIIHRIKLKMRDCIEKHFYKD